MFAMFAVISMILPRVIRTAVLFPALLLKRFPMTGFVRIAVLEKINFHLWNKGDSYDQR